MAFRYPTSASCDWYCFAAYWSLMLPLHKQTCWRSRSSTTAAGDCRCCCSTLSRIGTSFEFGSLKKLLTAWAQSVSTCCET